MSGRGRSRPYDPADLIEIEDEASLPRVPPLAVLRIDPVTGYIPAPLLTGADGKTSLDLDHLPLGRLGGDLPVVDAPQGARNAAARIDGNWIWRLVSGEGWVIREGKGAERSDGTRPKIKILEPCRSVTLRAIGCDEAFPYVTHHVVLAWVAIERTGAWSPEGAWAGSTEPSVAHRRCWIAGPRRIGVTACKGVLGLPPDARGIDAALAAARAADSDQDVST